MAKTSLKIPAKTVTTDAEATSDEAAVSSSQTVTEAISSSHGLQLPTSGGAFQINENGELSKAE
jgi:hypothetical protein